MDTKNETSKNDFNATIGNTVLSAVHLAPYLPYKLKCLVTDKGKYKIGSLFAVYDNGEYSFYDTIESEKGFSEVKPILRPISDLDWKIKVEFDKYDNKRIYDEEIINLFCEENGIDELLGNIELSSIRYECVEYIFKNHYDFFGLIEKGLAIDTNTLSVE